jgi:hypothetical protein
MELLLIGLAALAIAFVAIPLAVLRAGIRRLDQADSLTCRPPGISTALARRILGLYAHLPTTADQYDHEHSAPPTVPNRRPWAS